MNKIKHSVRPLRSQSRTYKKATSTKREKGEYVFSHDGVPTNTVVSVPIQPPTKERLNQIYNGISKVVPKEMIKSIDRAKENSLMRLEK
jgi:chaperone required for assembly of F1-ATPase